LKKRTKKLLDFGADSPASLHAKEQKSFASFLQKRRLSFFFPMPNTVRILYFAWLRERIGCAEESIVLPDNIADIAGLVAHLRARGGAYESVFSLGRVVRAAVNQRFASPETALTDGAEVAFFPPVTGG
jgi:molybdopterin synthase sulfur carrier subunit